MIEFGTYSNTFYRLIKRDKNYTKSWFVYDFHTSYPDYTQPDRPYHWIVKYTVNDINQYGEITGYKFGIREVKNIEKNYGNKLYIRLKEHGFVAVGKFEQDVLGKERKI